MFVQGASTCRRWRAYCAAGLCVALRARRYGTAEPVRWPYRACVAFV